MGRLILPLLTGLGAIAAYAGYHLRKARQLTLRPFTDSLDLGTSLPGPPLRLLIAGDSLGAGVGASSLAASVAGRIAAYLAKDRPVALRNEAISGSKMADVALRWPVDKGHDLIILFIGSNDLFRFTPLDRFETATQKAFRALSDAAPTVIVVGPGRIYEAGVVPRPFRFVYRRRAPRYARIMRKEAALYPNVTYVYPGNPPNGILPTQRTESGDRFHPNDDGYAYWFDLVRAGLQIAGWPEAEAAQARANSLTRILPGGILQASDRFPSASDAP